MNRYKLSQAGVRVNEGVDRFAGNQELYAKFLGRFPEDPNYARLCQAVADGDVKASFEAAHALKGIAGNLSLARLYDDLFPLVEQLRAGKTEQAQTLLDAVKRDYEEVVAALG